MAVQSADLRRKAARLHSSGEDFHTLFMRTIPLEIDMKSLDQRHLSREIGPAQDTNPKVNDVRDSPTEWPSQVS